MIKFLFDEQIDDKALTSNWEYKPKHKQNYDITKGIVAAGKMTMGVAKDQEYDQAYSTFITVYKFICNPKARVTFKCKKQKHIISRHYYNTV